jgi:hypothetical protein
MRVRIRERGEAARCAFCHDGFGCEGRCSCEACGSVYHVDCGARCATLGCRGRVGDRRGAGLAAPRRWTLRREGFWRPELVLASSGSEFRLANGQILERDGERMTLGVRGRCGRVHTLRDSRGMLVAAAMPDRSGGYQVSVGRGGRLSIGHRRESFFRCPIVVEQAGEVVVRFDGSAVVELRSSVRAPVLAFLVHLQRVMSDAEASAAMIVAVS